MNSLRLEKPVFARGENASTDNAENAIGQARKHLQIQDRVAILCSAKKSGVAYEKRRSLDRDSGEGLDG
jgi:hypothetical protein